MSRQHRAPYLINGQNPPQTLDPATTVFDEAWLQKFVYEHPVSIPIDEVEPAFAPLVPLCTELPTKAGPIDIAFINQLGLLTLVECKLWRNPEARRNVVGQILDYAKEVCRWDYEMLEEAVRKRRGGEFSLYGAIQDHSEPPAERAFTDAVSRNLRRGRFLLLLLGDGIRETTSQIGDYLNEHAHLNFALALVEMGVFRLPGESDERFIVVPRVVAETVSVEKAVVRIEEGRVVVVGPQTKNTQPAGRPKKVSEEVFFEMGMSRRLLN